jgi:hypothetical protein
MKNHTPKRYTIQAAQTLTASYVTQGDATKAVGVDGGQVYAGHGRDQIMLELSYVAGDETSMELRVQFSDTPEFTVVSDPVVVETASGVSTIYPRTYTRTATSLNFMIPVTSYGHYFRVQAKGTGAPTGTLATKVRLDVIHK